MAKEKLISDTFFHKNNLSQKNSFVNLERQQLLLK